MYIIFSWCIHLEPPMTWVPQQTEATAKRRVERAGAFVAPVEAAAATVEEKRKRKRREVEASVDGDEGRVGKKKKKQKRDGVIS
jgi:ribosomal RNA assembly protein